MSYIGKSIMIFELCKGWCLHLLTTSRIHFMLPVLLLFHALLDTTFLDVSVFKRCTVGMSSILANLKSRFQSVPKWSRRYAWGCKWSACLPVARILPRPKPSKSFAKARPIIACDRCWHSRLTAFLAKGVFQIMISHQDRHSTCCQFSRPFATCGIP